MNRKALRAFFAAQIDAAKKDAATPAFKPVRDVPNSGNWRSADPKNVGEFCGVGFWFARRVQRDIKIPIGLVPYVQSLLLARYLRGDLDAYPPFLMK